MTKRKPVCGKDTIPTARFMTRANTATTSGLAHGVLSTPMASLPKSSATISHDRGKGQQRAACLPPYFRVARSGTREQNIMLEMILIGLAVIIVVFLII